MNVIIKKRDRNAFFCVKVMLASLTVNVSQPLTFLFSHSTYTVGNANHFCCENFFLRHSIISFKPFIVIFKSSSNKCNILFIGLARGNEDITEPCLHSARWPDAALFCWGYLSFFISALQMEYNDECRLEGFSYQSRKNLIKSHYIETR